MSEVKPNWPKEPVFRGDNGKWITQGLFMEFSSDNTFWLYTIMSQDKTTNGVTYLSLQRLYLEIADPTEYEFANICFENWTHWQAALQNKLIAQEVEKWREELKIKLRSQGIKGMLAEAKSGNAKASQWLAENGFIEKTGRGRPTKADVAKAARESARIKDDLQRDIERISKH